MEPSPLPDEQLVNIVTEFGIVLGRIMVPTDPNFPFGEGVRFTIKFDDGHEGHLLLPPELARKVGQGMIDSANHANEIYLPGPRTCVHGYDLGNCVIDGPHCEPIQT